MNRFCMTIDGPSSCGKSSVARKLSAILGIFHLDSGAIYRSFAWWVENSGLSMDMKNLLENFSYKIVCHAHEEPEHFVGDTRVTHLIREKDVERRASELAILPDVRNRINAIQKELVQGKNFIAEGRDEGSVVFPKASIKVFLFADSAIRAERRKKEREDNESIQEYMHDMHVRDKRDVGRKIAPLVRPKDAILINATNFSIDEVTHQILAYLRRREKVGFRFWSYVVGPQKACASLAYKLTCFFSGKLLRYFYDIEAKGWENYSSESIILSPNHVSYFDSVAIGILWPNELHFLASSHLLGSRLFRWIFDRGNIHFVSGMRNIEAVRKSIDLLLKGKQLVIFPEGTRSWDGQLAPLKKGISFLTMAAKCKIIPVSVSGTYEIWPRWKILPKKKGKIVVTFGKPIEWGKYAKMAQKEARGQILQDLNASMRQLLQENGAIESKEYREEII